MSSKQFVHQPQMIRLLKKICSWHLEIDSPLWDPECLELEDLKNTPMVGKADQEAELQRTATTSI